MDAPPPVPKGKKYNIDLTGMLFLWANEQPVLVRVAGDPNLHLPIFSSKDKLVVGAADFGLSYERIKQILDGHDFLDSVRESDPSVRVIVDPYKKGDKVRYTLVQEDLN